jgi:hypothetical protein
MPRTRRHHLGERSEYAAAAIACLEKRQHLPLARGFHRRRAELARCSGAEQEVTTAFLWRGLTVEQETVVSANFTLEILSKRLRAGAG